MSAYVARMHIYFREMLPLPKTVFSAVLAFSSFFLLLVAVNGNTNIYYPAVWYGLLTLFLYFVTFRLNDELKDIEFDKVHNPNRPMVTGRVKYSDLKILILILLAVMLALNFDRGFVSSAFLIWLSFLMLSARWFYFTDIVQKSFVLTTLTHQPILPLTYFYVFAVYNSVTSSPMELSWLVIGLCLLLSLPSVAWEVSRKIRAPMDENEYPSYSSRWGFKNAVMMPMFYIALTTVLFVVLGIQFQFSIYYVIGNLLMGLVTLFTFVRFYIFPTSKNNVLKQSNELYDLGIRLAIVSEVVIGGGV